jgi:hypothetical protein
MFDSITLVLNVATFVTAAVAVALAYQARQAAREAHAVALDTLCDVTEPLREDLAVAVAEGADAVIARLPEPVETPPAEPLTALDVHAILERRLKALGLAA